MAEFQVRRTLIEGVSSSELLLTIVGMVASCTLIERFWTTALVALSVFPGSTVQLLIEVGSD